MEWTEVKARLVMRSPILAISLMGGPNSSESNKLVQGKVFSLRQLQVKRLVLLNSSSKSKKPWIRGVAWMTFPQSAHRPRLSKPTGQSLRSTAPPPKQPLLQLTNSPHASPSLKATSGRLLNNSRFLALIIEIYLTCLHPKAIFTILTAPALLAGVLGTHSNRYAPPPPCLSCAFDNPKPIRAVTYNSSLLS